jgi:hypothetical protein
MGKNIPEVCPVWGTPALDAPTAGPNREEVILCRVWETPAREIYVYQDGVPEEKSTVQGPTHIQCVCRFKSGSGRAVWTGQDWRWVQWLVSDRLFSY